MSSNKVIRSYTNVITLAESICAAPMLLREEGTRKVVEGAFWEFQNLLGDSRHPVCLAFQDVIKEAVVESPTLPQRVEDLRKAIADAAIEGGLDIVGTGKKFA